MGIVYYLGHCTKIIEKSTFSLISKNPLSKLCCQGPYLQRWIRWGPVNKFFQVVMPLLWRVVFLQACWHFVVPLDSRPKHFLFTQAFNFASMVWLIWPVSSYPILNYPYVVSLLLSIYVHVYFWSTLFLDLKLAIFHYYSYVLFLAPPIKVCFFLRHCEEFCCSQCSHWILVL